MSASTTITGGVRQWKPYPAYKESGLSTGVQIPSHWSMMRLKHIAVVRPSNVDKKTVEGQVAVRLCNYVDVYKNESITADFDFMLASATPAQVVAYTLQSGDVIVTKDSETWMDIAVPAHVEADLPGVLCGYHLALVRPRKEQVVGAFLFRCFAAAGLRDQFRVAANGITRFGLGTGAIADSAFPLPPLDEQRRIVTFLDREAVKIDALVAKKERLIELLQEKRTALISHAVTKGVDPTVPMKDSGVKWLGKIPSHWQIIQSRRVFSVRNEPATESDEQLTASQKYGMLPQTDFMELEGRRVVATIKGTDSLRHVEPDDFVISLRSFQGGIEWCKIPGSVTFHYIVLKPAKTIHPPYFGQLFKSNVFIQALRSTTDFIRDGQDLRYSHFVLVPLPVVPLAEQAAIAKFLERETAAIDSLIGKVQAAIEKLREYRTSLISAAVTGKIDVSSEAVAVVEQTATSEKPTPKPANPYFRRSVFAAEIIDRLCDEPTFGHVKFQKCLFVAQHHLRVEDFEENYKRMAAGPYDNRLVRSVDSQLEKGRWFKAEKVGDRYAYRRLDKAGGHRQYFDRYFGEHAELLGKLLDLFRPLDTDRAEIVATLYAVWNDFLLRGEACDDDRIVAEVLTNWHDRKKRFDEARWRRALERMREKELVPTGFGKPTLPGGENV